MALQPFDLVVLLKLAIADGPRTDSQIAAGLHATAADIREALARAATAHLYSPSRRALNRLAFKEFLVHALYFAFPAELRPVKHRRGVPTAWSAAPLLGRIVGYEGDVAIWPIAGGPVAGAVAIEPLDERAIAIAQEDPAMHEMLALVDAIRAGRAREKELAKEAIVARIR